MKCTTGVKKYIVTHLSSKKTENSFEDDYVTKCMGAFGYWQAMICPIICFVRFIVQWNVISIVYLTPTTEFACTKFSNGSDADLFDVENSTCYDDCVEYEYFNDVFEETIVSKFGLICENKWMRSFTQTMIMFGLLVGVSLLGWVSDRCGRRKAFLAATIIAVVFTLASSYAPSYWIFTGLRFFVGVGVGGIMTLSVIVNIEMIGQKYRAYAGALSILPDGSGQLLLAIIAYYSSTWHRLILIYGSISVFLLLLLLFFVPETPRWFVAHRRSDEAIEMMTKVAKFNGLPTAHIKDTVNKAIEDMHSQQDGLKTYHYADLFGSTQMAKITITSVLMWMAGGICLFGLNHYSTLLGLNIFYVVPLMGLLQLIAPFIALVLNNCCGRRFSIAASFFVIGIAITALIFIPDGHWGCTVTTGIGIMCSITLFGTIYTQSNELFPTPLRNMGVGISSAGSKLGAMIAPFIANTQPHWVASTIFAVVPFVGVLISLVLPETKNKTLKDTID